MNPPQASDWSTAYSPDYLTARTRLLGLAESLGDAHDAWPLDQQGPTGEPLTIDLVRLGSSQARRLLVISSGLHGVEGYFGSAVQLAFATRLKPPSPDMAVVLLHALNPFGFAWRRRFDAENIDPNRNFLLPGEEYRGAPPLYGPIYQLFRMDVPPLRFNPGQAARVAYIIARYGLHQLRLTIPVGQYEFPLGPFFGGKGPCATQRLLATHLDPHWQHAEEIIHVDLHTGLGSWGRYKLLIDDQEESPKCTWWQQHFGTERVEVCQRTQTAYPARGSLGPWLCRRYAHLRYYYSTLEFGTYRPKKIMDALIDETRAFNCGLLSDPRYEWTRRQLMEVFVPADPAWRHHTVRQAVEVLEECQRLLTRPNGTYTP
jgi:hypothetical protein